MLVLILSIIINLIIIYFFYKRIIHKIEFPQKKELSEINSLMVEFNKLTKNNVDLIEEKIEELKKVVKIADEKILNLSKGIKENIDIAIREDNLNLTTNKNTKLNSSKKQDKYKTIEKLLKKKKSPQEIAEFLGISISEVKLYINLIKESKNK